jgi:hypothetical protein
MSTATIRFVDGERNRRSRDALVADEAGKIVRLDDATDHPRRHFRRHQPLLRAIRKLGERFAILPVEPGRVAVAPQGSHRLFERNCGINLGGARFVIRLHAGGLRLVVLMLEQDTVARLPALVAVAVVAAITRPSGAAKQFVDVPASFCLRSGARDF